MKSFNFCMTNGVIFRRGTFQALVVFVLAALVLIPGNALAKDKKIS